MATFSWETTASSGVGNFKGPHQRGQRKCLAFELLRQQVHLLRERDVRLLAPAREHDTTGPIDQHPSVIDGALHDAAQHPVDAGASTFPPASPMNDCQEAIRATKEGPDAR